MATPTLATAADHRLRLALHEMVFSYVGSTTQVNRIAELSDGVILEDGDGYRQARYTGDTRRLVDPEFYLMQRDQREGESLFPPTPSEAITQQLDAGVACLLAPSEFPRDRGPDSIEQLLVKGRDFVETAELEAPDLPAIVPIVVRFDELADRRWVTSVRESELPIATVFAGFRDPLDKPDRIEGALDLIAAAKFALVMRCDVAAGGLVAHGAAAAAIGTSSAVRHLWLPSRTPGKRTPRSPVFVPSTAAWIDKSRLVDAGNYAVDDELWKCECAACGPDGDMRSLVGASDSSIELHSVAAAMRLVHIVFDAQDRVEAWKRICEQSAAAFRALTEAGMPGLKQPDGLKSWLEVLR
ncbi:hypothetical protein [Candidatus Poriferisodalis sp.]|uniref:hypothetical protein n=1 Tax=Candidatus Poriferisodalis sp. TaxID=3101277 RepID=UPI003B019742